MSVTINGTTGIAGVDGSASTPAYQGADTNTGIAFPAADTVSVATGGTERMRITSSGNVGIGTSSPTATLDTYIGTGLTTFGDFANSVRVQGGNDVNKYVPITFGGYGSYAPAAIAYLVTSGSGNTKGDLVFGTRDVTTDTRPTERMRIDSVGNLLFNSGYGSVATAYGCRAWVKFNGTGTVAINASGNVSSITDNGTGDYTVNFTTAMVDSNYAASVVGWTSSYDRLMCSPPAGTSWSTTVWRIFCSAWTGSSFNAGQDANIVSASFFR